MAPPSEDQVARLTQRVYHLEQQLEELRRGLQRSGVSTVRAPSTTAVPPQSRLPVRTPKAPPPVRVRERRDEAEVFGAWFARTGAIVLLIGCGFAFKYAVDRGVIGPSARVALGIAAGIGLVIAAEWASRRGWSGWGQAVAGAGIALTYLSVLAAMQLYDLIAPAPAFVVLVVITVCAGYLSIRHGSLVLALLATVGGYLNAVLLTTETPRPLAVLSYLLALEAGILGLAFLRRWRALDWAALIGTATVFGLTQGDADFGVRLAFATTYLVLLVGISVAHAFRGTVDVGDLVIAAAGSLLYYRYVGVLLNDNGFGDKQGALALTMGLATVAVGSVMRRRSERLWMGSLFLGVAFGVLFVPAQFSVEMVPIGLAVEAMLLTWAGSYEPLRLLRSFGVALVGISLLVLIAQFGDLEPERLLFSQESAVFVVEILAFCVIAWILRRNPQPLPPESAATSVLVAIALAVAWISVEVTAELDRSGASDQALQFAVSAVWGSFATALLALGVSLRMRWIRVAGVALFGVVLTKLALADLWTLSTSYRFMAFVGLGATLLACSLGFYRFREYLVGTPDAEPRSPAGA